MMTFLFWHVMVSGIFSLQLRFLETMHSYHVVEFSKHAQHVCKTKCKTE